MSGYPKTFISPVLFFWIVFIGFSLGDHSYFPPAFWMSAIFWFLGFARFCEGMSLCDSHVSVFGVSCARRTQHVVVYIDAEQRNFKQNFAALSLQKPFLTDFERVFR